MTSAVSNLIRECVRFAVWGAGEGLSPIEGELASAPEDFLYEYSTATDDTDWETLADRIAPVPDLEEVTAVLRHICPADKTGIHGLSKTFEERIRALAEKLEASK